MKITADGKYKINSHAMSKSIVYVKGDAGTATLQLQIFGEDVIDGLITVGTQTEVRHGSDIALTLAVGGGVTDIDVRCVGIH